MLSSELGVLSNGVIFYYLGWGVIIWDGSVVVWDGNVII
jgi:hypothetical protein